MLNTYFEQQGIVRNSDTIGNTVFFVLGDRRVKFDAGTIDLENGDIVKVAGIVEDADTRSPKYEAKIVHVENTGKTFGKMSGLWGLLFIVVMIGLTVIVAALCMLVVGLMLVPQLLTIWNEFFVTRKCGRLVSKMMKQEKISENAKLA